MISRQKIQSLYKLAAMGGGCGLLLLVRPLLYSIFARRRDLNAYASVDASAVVFIVYAVICFFLAARELNRKEKTFGRDLFIHTPLLWLSLYTVLGMVSMIWSINLQLTGFRAFECMSMTMLMVAVVQNLFYHGGCKTVIQWTMLYVTVDIIFSITRALSYTTNVMMLQALIFTLWPLPMARRRKQRIVQWSIHHMTRGFLRAMVTTKTIRLNDTGETFAEPDRKSTRLNSSHTLASRMPSSA